jgi:hypothetical protein
MDKIIELINKIEALDEMQAQEGCSPAYRALIKAKISELTKELIQI